MSSIVLVTGGNKHGQLGLGGKKPFENVSTFRRLELQNCRVKSLSMSESHMLIVGDDGLVFSCGSGAGGRLGHNNEVDLCVPVVIASLSHIPIVAAAAGPSHSLFLDRNGVVYACGLGKGGKLGIDPIPSKLLVPTPVTSLGKARIVAIATGNEHSLFLDADGGVWTCGSSYYGQLGHGDRVSRHIPEKISIILEDGPLRFRQCVAGGDHSLLLAEEGDVWAFGWNEMGQCGFSHGEDVLAPTRIDGLAAFRVCSISAGDTHSVFVNALGLVYTCGSGQFGRLGHGDEQNRMTPTNLSNLSRIKVVHCAAGKDHTLLVDQNERVYTFGWGNYGALGSGENTRVKPTLVNVPFKSKEHVIGAFAGGFQTCILAGTKEQQQEVARQKVLVDGRRESCVIS